MNRLIYTLIAVFILQLPVLAQKGDQRTTATKIADLLAQQPALNEQKLNEAMLQIDGFQATDIAALLQQLTPLGKGNNSKIEYATNSYSFYVMSPDRENQRAKFVQGLTIALNEVSDKDNKGYIIALLQKSGKDDAVAALTPYLKDEYTSGKAARALATIGTPAASNALLSELPQASGHAQISIVEALGDIKYAEAESAILPLLNTDNTDLQKVALYALANIGGASSVGALKSAAQNAGYTYDITNATASYVHYANQLSKKGNNKLAESIAKALINDAKADEQKHTRIAALGLLTNINGANFSKNLIKASKDKNAEYSAEAIKLAIPYLNNDNKRWVKALKKADENAKVNIISLLSNSGDLSVVPALKKSLKSSSELERAAAVNALSKLAGDAAAPDLLLLLAKGNDSDRVAISKAFSTMDGDNLPVLLTAALPNESPENQIVIIGILSARAYPQSYDAISSMLSSEDATVRKASYEALQMVARTKDLDALFPLLKTSQAEELKSVQAAIVNVVENSPEKDSDIDKVLNSYKGATDQQKVKYLGALSGIGGAKALEVVSASINGNNADLKSAVVFAVANWKDDSALNTLIALSKDTKDAKEFNAVLRGLVRITAASKLPAEQKVLTYRDAMEVAVNADQKKLILRNIEANKTYTALLYASSFLDDKDLQKVAANTVMNIALADKSFYGEDVKAALNKVAGLLSGSESSYLKEAVNKHLAEMPHGPGYVSLFNGKDLSGWKGLVGNPIKRAQMSTRQLAEAQKKADEKMREGWEVRDKVLVFKEKGDNIATIKEYGDFEMLVDWKLDKDGEEGDAGVYLRGTPQVQIWDISRTNVGAQVGSGGLYNNKTHSSVPTKVADNPLGEWNTFKIRMIGDKVTVYLNGELVVDNVVLENYWDRNQSIFPVEQIELQAHGTLVYYRDIFIKEIPRKEIFQLSEQEKKEGFKVLFDGTNLDSWTGNTSSYVVSDEGTLAIYPTKGSGGNLYTKEEFGDFVYRFEFRLTPGANNGIGIRTPLTGNAAYEGMEIQVLDDDADMYSKLEQYQYHGSVYGIMAAKRGSLKPMGEWNQEEISIKGNDIKVTLNGTVILEGNLDEATKNGTLDKKDHPGLKRNRGHIAFLGHGSEVHFKNIRIKDLSK